MSAYDELIETPPHHSEAVAALCRWAGNYDYPSPYILFLDLIGFSGEEYGEVLFVAPDNEHQADLIDSRLGYLELGMLADALGEYALNPRGVRAYVDALDAAEREADE